MFHIILLILKIIGVSILVLLGIILLMLLMILLIPIRYRLDAEHGDELRIVGRVNWLLHIINTRISYLEGKLHIRVRILWFTLYDNLKPKRPKRHKKMKASKIQSRLKVEKKQKVIKETKLKKRAEGRLIKKKQLMVKEEVKVYKEPEPLGSIETDKRQEFYDNIKDSKVILDIKAEQKIELKEEKVETAKEPKDQENNWEKEEDERSFFGLLINKLVKIKEKIVSIWKSIENTVRKWIETFCNIKHKGGVLLDFIKNEKNKEGFEITFDSLKKILKHVLPAKLQSKVAFGTGDPCSTGQILGAAAILYSIYGDKIQIIPDFENKIFEGKHNAKGRIRLVTILIITIKLIFDKRFKRLKSNFQILKEAL